MPRRRMRKQSVQCLQHDDAVALGESCRLDVQEVVALSPHLAVDARGAKLGLLSILRSFLPSADGALGASKSLERGFEVARVGDHLSVGRGAEVGNAAVDGYDRTFARRRVRQLDVADDASVPLVAVSLERARLGCAFERSVQDCPECAELGESQAIILDAPHLRMRLAERECGESLAFPPRGASELREAALPRFVQLDQELIAYVAWDVGEPRQCGAQLGQLVDLVERGRVSTLVLRAGVPCLALLQGEIPKPTQRALPLAEPRDLSGVRIDAEAKGLARAHGVDHTLVRGTRKRLSYCQARRLRVDGSLGLRAKVSPQGYQRARVCRTQGLVGGDVQGLRVRAARVRLRGRPRASFDRVPPEGVAFDARQFAQGRQRSPSSRGALAGSRAQALGTALLVPELLRGVVWRRPVGDRQTVRRTTESESGSSPA